MTNAEIVQALFKRLFYGRYGAQENEQVFFEPVILRMLEELQTAKDNQELSEADQENFLNTTSYSDLFKAYIKQAQRDMLVKSLSNPVDRDTRVYNASINKLTDYLERLASIMHADGLEILKEDELHRLGVSNISALKEILDNCHLIKKDGNAYSFELSSLKMYLVAQLIRKEAHGTIFPYQKDLTGKTYIGIPMTKPKPWDIQPQTHKQQPSITSQVNTTQTITSEEFEQILHSYKSTSILGYLSTFWIFSWISPTRSETIRALNNLQIENSQSNAPNINKDAIEQAIEQSEAKLEKKHRLNLFKGNAETEKNGTSTDDVVEQLSQKFKK